MPEGPPWSFPRVNEQERRACMKIRDIIKSKSIEVIAINGDQTVAEAVAKMVKRNIGALIIMEDECPTGMFTERDVLKCWQDKERVQDKPVRDIMSRGLRVVDIDDTVQDAMSVMVQKGIRHLPVVEGERILNVLSIRDIINAHVSDLTTEVRYLKDFISTAC
jgi:signal-transduction protein with cAMP-binding, CBS, and nucleotidyltransferase domain